LHLSKQKLRLKGKVQKKSGSSGLTDGQTGRYF
jgi:hypothetical protein